jgi:hypothetical protein
MAPYTRPGRHDPGLVVQEFGSDCLQFGLLFMLAHLGQQLALGSAGAC